MWHPTRQPKPGLHAYPRHSSDGEVRVHLRLEADGNGLLLVNADRALHLNPTAAAMTWFLLEGAPQDEAVAYLRRRYRVSARTALADLESLRHQLDELCQPNGPCLIHDLNLELLPPFSQTPSAPYRMDLALTYRCNNDCPHCYNARPRSYPELTTQDWKAALERLWEVGVPHICFTGGEATLRHDLPELIAHAQRLGQVTGLLTNGRRLADRNFVECLVEAGLDHVQITLESHDPAVHDQMVESRGAWRQTVEGIRNALAARLYVMTNTTLLSTNSSGILSTIRFLADLGVPTVGINALIHAGRGAAVGTGLPEAALGPLLAAARQVTERHGQRLIWYTPTQYCHFDPMQLGLGVKGCTAARYNMCVEPDGSVIPCQSYYQPVGNLLRDPWDAIWNHDLSIWLRERRYVPASCRDCAVLAECGGGCPLSLPVTLPEPRAVAAPA
ncbi:MAG: PqqD family peptide modification chaperone [Chloroflexota bacterium]